MQVRRAITKNLSDSRVVVSGLKMYLICTPTPSQYTSALQSDHVETLLLGESNSPAWLLTLLREGPCCLHCLSQASLSLSLKWVLGKLCLQNASGIPLCNINISALDTKYDLQMKMFCFEAISGCSYYLEKDHFNIGMSFYKPIAGSEIHQNINWFRITSRLSSLTLSLCFLFITILIGCSGFICGC